MLNTIKNGVVIYGKKQNYKARKNLAYYCQENGLKHFQQEIKGSKKVMENHNTMGLKVGDKIRIIEMIGEPQYSGKVGTIELIYDFGLLHGTWGGLAVRAERDKWERI